MFALILAVLLLQAPAPPWAAVWLLDGGHARLVRWTAAAGEVVLLSVEDLRIRSYSVAGGAIVLVDETGARHWIKVNSALSRSELADMERLVTCVPVE